MQNSDILAQLDTLCVSIATEANRQYERNFGSVLYLYGAMENGVYRTLRVSHDKPKYFEMVILNKLPCHLTTDDLAYWLREHLRVAPIVQEDHTMATLQEESRRS